MYKIWFINFGYLADPVFDTPEDAVAWGKSKGFEFSVFKDGDPIGSATGVTLSWRTV